MSHPPVPGMGVLVPPIALVVGLFAGLLVYRHGNRNRIPFAWQWAVFCGAAFFLAPIALRSYFEGAYYVLFVPPGPGVVVKPLHALATILAGGVLTGCGITGLYGTFAWITTKPSTNGPNQG